MDLKRCFNNTTVDHYLGWNCNESANLVSKNVNSSSDTHVNLAWK